ncbi:response regulator, partial [Candidatus Sumerlaeota bacterium]|nr:response regulator [Candidatus Sumerlaeota bacterium]
MAEKKKILVIDDETDARAIIRLSLQASGLEVIEAANGKQGLEVLKDTKPDLIVVDIMMPEMNGVEFCRRMVDDLGLKDVPVLVLSAVSEKAGVVREIFDLPLAKKGFIRKPLEINDLITKVGEMLGQKLAPLGGGKPSGKRGAPAAKAAKSAPKAKTAMAGPRYRVLVVDDEEDIRAVLKAGLGLRHEVETADNGMDALAKIDRFNPDFIICDINMPVMNGLETVEAVRRHPKFGSIPFFFLTGEKAESLPRESFDRGVNLFLRKPVDPIRLLKVIDYFVKEAQFSPRAPAARKPPGPPKQAKPASSGAPSVVRVLSVGHDQEQAGLLKGFLGDARGGGYETLWAADSQTALGNLGRWEPDVIFCNPRSPGYDGIAFGQLLRVKKIAGNFEMAFVGKKFYDADLEYSRKNFGREVITLSLKADAVRSRLRDVIDGARAKVSVKKRTLADMASEEQEFAK